MVTIKGIVLDKANNPVYGARVFLSDISGKISPSNTGTTTDFDGKFTLRISENPDGTHLTATTLDGGRKSQRYNPSISDYEFDLTYAQSQNLPEVTVIGTRPQTQITPKITPKKKRNYLLIGAVSIGALLLIGGIYMISKKA